MATGSPRNLILEALALTGVVGDGGNPGVLPPARARQKIDRMLDAGSAEELRNISPNFKELLTETLDWDRQQTQSDNAPADTGMDPALQSRLDELSAKSPEDLTDDEKRELRKLRKEAKRSKAKAKAKVKAAVGPVRATSTNVRIVAGLLAAEDPRGYTAGVSAVSFAMAAGSVLDPDRLGTLLESTAGAAIAYAPLRYPAQASASLSRLLSHFTPDQRLGLLTSLWNLAHDPSRPWWDVAGIRRRMRRLRGEAAIAAELEAAASTDSPLNRLVEKNVIWTPALGTEFSTLELTSEEELLVGNWVTHARSPFPAQFLAAHLPTLAPRWRPQSPLLTLISSLEAACGDHAPSEVLNDEAEEWQELIPAGSFEQFPIPDHILELDWQTLPGTGVGDVAPAVISLCHNEHQLNENRNYMGNCTGTYKDRCEQGTVVIGKVLHDGEVYNFSVYPDLRIGEVNSRFNRGQVPPVISNGLRAAVAQCRTEEA